MTRAARRSRTRTGVSAVLARLRALARKETRAAQARYRIDTGASLGLTVPQIRALARELGRSHALATRLWATGVHEARHLAVMVEEPALVTAPQVERQVRDFASWDIVDGYCRYLLIATPHAWPKARAWMTRREEFVKRAGFATLAYLAVHDASASDAAFVRFLPAIARGARDGRNFVRKAVNWALRQIGKRSRGLNRRAIACARALAASDSRSARRVGSDALRELSSRAVQARLRARHARA